MKRIAMLLLLAGCFANAQETATTEDGKVVILNKNGTYKYLKQPSSAVPKETTYLTQKDFKKTEKGYTILPRKIFLKNAEEEIIPITFSFTASDEEFAKTNVQWINEMISTANMETMYKLKNKFTYSPRKMMLFYDPREKFWIASITYTAQNDYGATKDGTAVCRRGGDGVIYDVNFM